MQKSNKRILPGLAAAAVLSLSLLVVGCGNDEAATSGAGASDGATTSATTATPDGAAETPAIAGPPAPPETPAPAAGGGAFDTKPFKATVPARTTPSGLKIEDMTIGKGATAETGKKAVVHYTGTLTNGTKFDASRDRNEPFPFTIGAQEVIAGWDEGVAGMKVGGRRKLTIPASIAYGADGRPPVIPPNATLVFDVELMDVQ